MDPSLSVIIPFFNASRFLASTIENVLDQTFKDYELLLCDDGSTDGSTEIAKKYAADHPDRVRYFNHPDHSNRGQFSTRILGAKNARSTVLALLDADDMWDKDYLEKHLKIWRSVESQGVYLSYGPSLYWFSDTPEEERDFIQQMPEGAPGIYQPGELLEKYLSSGYGNTPCPSCTFIRQEVFREIARYEAVSKKTLAFEDQILCWYVAARWPVAVHCNVWVRYRQHSTSSVASIFQNKKARKAELEFLKVISNNLPEALPEHALIKYGILNKRMDDLMKLPLKELIKENLNEIMPPAAYMKLRDLFNLARDTVMRLPRLPGIRNLSCIKFRRLHPLKNGKQYGTPIVRYYWERYLFNFQDDIRGHSLEIGTTETIRRFGGKTLEKADAIDFKKHSCEITVVADLSRADHVPPDTYDCFVNQFSMTFIYDIEAALYHSIRILKPGGILLVNFPCLEYYFPDGLDMYTDNPIYMHWWFTPIMVENLFRRAGLTNNDFELEISGNLFARIAYQMNMPAEELTRKELEYIDGGHPLLICARVIKPANWRAKKPEYRDPWLPKGKPVRWDPVTGHYPSL